MTQFMLCVPDPIYISTELPFRPISEEETFLTRAARAVFGNESAVYVPSLTSGPSIAELFMDAHNVIYNGDDFKQLNSVRPYSRC
jgi:hypothetical protein